jgi:hypothetical protein
MVFRGLPRACWDFLKGTLNLTALALRVHRRHRMPRKEDAAARDSSNTSLCQNCSKALQKPLVCARCKAATYCSKDCQVHTAHRKRGGLAIKAVIDF